jgi:hypothetical protein
MMCLYGEDEKLLRIAAMELNMTVSHLIRLAIYRYLPKVEKETFDWRFIYYYGTRICRYLDITRVNQKKFLITIMYFLPNGQLNRGGGVHFLFYPFHILQMQPRDPVGFMQLWILKYIRVFFLNGI